METRSLMKTPWIPLPIIYAFVPHIVRQRCTSTVWNLCRIQMHVVPSPSAVADFSDASTWQVLFVITLLTNNDSDEVSQNVIFSLLKLISLPRTVRGLKHIYPAHCTFSSQWYFWAEKLVGLPWKLLWSIIWFFFPGSKYLDKKRVTESLRHNDNLFDLPLELKVSNGSSCNNFLHIL